MPAGSVVPVPRLKKPRVGGGASATRAEGTPLPGPAVCHSAAAGKLHLYLCSRDCIPRASSMAVAQKNNSFSSLLPAATKALEIGLLRK